MSRPYEIGFDMGQSHPEFEGRIQWLADRGIRTIALETEETGTSEIDVTTTILDRHEVRVVSLHAEPGLVSHTDGSDVRDALRIDIAKARAWKAENLVLHFLQLRSEWKDGVWWDDAKTIDEMGLHACDSQMADTVQWLLDETADCELGIMLENLPVHFQHSVSVDEIVEFAKRVKSPRVGLCLDSGHAHSAGLDIPDVIRNAGSWLKTTHLHDNFGLGTPHQTIEEVDRHLAPGLGTIDWPEIIQALDASGYEGVALFEAVNLGHYPPDAEDWRKAMTMTIDNWKTWETIVDPGRN